MMTRSPISRRNRSAAVVLPPPGPPVRTIRQQSGHRRAFFTVGARLPLLAVGTSTSGSVRFASWTGFGWFGRLALALNQDFFHQFGLDLLQLQQPLPLMKAELIELGREQAHF